MRELREYYLNLVPFIQAMAVLMADDFSNSAWFYYNWRIHHREPLESTYFVMTIMLCYMLIGLLFAWFAKRRFRRDIF
jgi:hypothetical protein